MILSVFFTPAEAGELSRSVCLVVDVLRATTALCTLFAQGCPEVYAAPSHGAAREFARPRGLLLCGESDGVPPPDFDYGNSPVQFSSMDFSGRPMVLSTSNGTGALARAASAPHVIAACARNRRAAAQLAWRFACDEGLDLAVICAGTGGSFTLEDTLTAGALVERLVAQAGRRELPRLTDSAIAARRLWEAGPDLLRGWMEGNHAQRLADIGFGEDLGYCAQLDCQQETPVLAQPGKLEPPWPVRLVAVG